MAASETAAYRAHLKAHGYQAQATWRACRVIPGDRLYTLTVTGLPVSGSQQFHSSNRLYPAYRDACQILTGSQPYSPEQAQQVRTDLFSALSPL